MYAPYLVSAASRKKRNNGDPINMIQGKTKHGRFRRGTSTSSNIHGEIQSSTSRIYRITVYFLLSYFNLAYSIIILI